MVFLIIVVGFSSVSGNDESLEAPPGSRKMRNLEPGTWNQEKKKRNWGTRNPEFGKEKAEPGTRNPEPGKEKAEPGTRNMEPGKGGRRKGGTRNPEHGTWETTENGNFTEAWKRALAVPGSGFRVPGSEFRVPGSRFRVPGSGFQVPPLLSPFRVPGSAVAVAVPGSGFRVPGSGFRVPGSRFRRFPFPGRSGKHWQGGPAFSISSISFTSNSVPP
jgi:hypothetical protein